MPPRQVTADVTFAPKVLAALASTALVLGLGACSSGSEAASPSPVASPSATLAPGVAWLDAACDVTVSLRGALRDLATAIDVVPDSDAAPTVGAPGFAEARSGVQTRLGGVAGVAAGVSVLGRPPVSSPLLPVSAAFERSTAGLQDSVQRLKNSAEEVTDAETLAQLAVGARAMAAPLASTTAEVDAVGTQLTGLATSKDAAVRRAYAAAPSCASLSR